MLHVPIHYLIERCSSLEALKHVHAQIIVHGLFKNTFIVGKFVAFCSCCGAHDLTYARTVFGHVPEPNRFMWNNLIRAYSNSDNPREALLLQRDMLTSGVLPNNFTLPFVLKSCASLSAFIEAQEVHALISKLGFRSQVFVQNSLLHAYAVCGCICSARQVFDEIPSPNIVSWNSIIDGYSKLGTYEEVFQLFRSMRYLNFEPDGFTFASLLSVCSQSVCLGLGKLVHNHVEVNGWRIDLIVGNALIDMYTKCGELSLGKACFDGMLKKNVVTWTSIIAAYAKHGLHDLAKYWFRKMPERNLISWNSMISSYAQHGKCFEALGLYVEMLSSNVKPDVTTLTSILSVCGQVGNLIDGKKIHQYTICSEMQSRVCVMNSLVDMYAKCGTLLVALDVFKRIVDKNVTSWNVIIGAFAMHGRAFDAIEHFTKMVADGLVPDGITFVAVLFACSHAGLLDDGLYYFKTMQQIYNLQPEIEHYACMIDLFGRRGYLKEAVHLISEMPMRPDAVIWGIVLGACRIHGNVNIGKLVIKQLLELQAGYSGLYVLTSNIYYEAYKWRDGNFFWKLMKDQGIRKARAASLIEIGGRIYEFLVEDKRLENPASIYSTLDQLTDNMMSIEDITSQHFVSWPHYRDEMRAWEIFQLLTRNVKS